MSVHNWTIGVDLGMPERWFNMFNGK